MRGQPPTGTVTLFFSDIENSTRLLQRQGEYYTAMLARHQQFLRAALAAHDGYEVSTQGDGFLAAFTRASDRPAGRSYFQ